MPATSFVKIENARFFYSSLSYIPDVVALFSESDFRSAEVRSTEDGNYFEFFGYEATVTQLRERLTTLGVTKRSAISMVEHAIKMALQD